jgi:hypothetical protein
MQTIKDRVALLIDLFYGFAIASGLPSGIAAILQPSSDSHHDSDVYRWLVIFSALLLSLSDVLFVFIFVKEMPYKGRLGFARFLLDIVFPIILFFLLFYPAAVADRVVSWFVAILFLYFLAAAVYSLLLKAELNSQPGLLKFALTSLGLSACSMALLARQGDAHAALMLVLSMAAVFVWTGYQFHLAYTELQQP